MFGTMVINGYTSEPFLRVYDEPAIPDFLRTQLVDAQRRMMRKRDRAIRREIKANRHAATAGSGERECARRVRQIETSRGGASLRVENGLVL